jgi:hypothetical protein
VIEGIILAYFLLVYITEKIKGKEVIAGALR